MAQIQSPETYADGQQVTAARLNNQVSGAVLLPGAVTDQTAIAGGVASGDSILVHDASTSALRKATVVELLGGGLPVVATTVSASESVTTPEVRSLANGDVRIVPQNGVAVTGMAFTSVAGTAVTINSTAHGLVAGQVISVTASVTAYSGVFSITSVTTDAIVYTLPVAATPASGTCSYTKQASERVAGNEVVEGNLYVAGQASVTGGIESPSVSTATLTASGVANFTGTLQYKSTPIFGLYQVTANLIHQTPGFVDVFNNIRIGSFADGWAVAGGDVTSASGGVHWKEAITVPAGEMWEVTWNWSAMRGTDDGFVVGVIRNVGGGAWSQIFNSVQAPTIYTNTPLCNVEILTNTTASAVTYNYAFKSACGPGSATDQAIACHGNGATRIIRRYKIAS
jgi:hypothetical protein